MVFRAVFMNLDTGVKARQFMSREALPSASGRDLLCKALQGTACRALQSKTPRLGRAGRPARREPRAAVAAAEPWGWPAPAGRRAPMPSATLAVSPSELKQQPDTDTANAAIDWP